MNSVVSFIIGLLITLVASVLNAGGLNLTKLDHVRTSALPKASRRNDFARPLWVIGMALYIISQLVGSSLALEYMRAEYVAPLGASSLIFNFLFASLLIGTPITRNDVYGTGVVIIGVIGIVAFGSINSGLNSEFSLAVLSHLWSRAGWIVYFSLMTFGIILCYIFTAQLEAVLTARADLSTLPEPAAMRRAQEAMLKSGWVGKTKVRWGNSMRWLRDRLEVWTAAKDDKQLAWTLGIGWACCGGAMAGGCLVFARATVKLVSGTINHQNTGAAFIHPAAIFTILLLILSAVFQIICLNRGLKVYDSTLVVPVFYGIYTASGFLNSLIFNDEVDAYKQWVLFLIALSILVLIGGVVLLTYKKPEPKPKPPSSQNPPLSSLPMRSREGKLGDIEEGQEDTFEGDDGERGRTVWEVGDDTEDEGHSDAKSGKGRRKPSPSPLRMASTEGKTGVEPDTRSIISTDDSEFEEWAQGRDDERIKLVDKPKSRR